MGAEVSWVGDGAGRGRAERQRGAPELPKERQPSGELAARYCVAGGWCRRLLLRCYDAAAAADELGKNGRDHRREMIDREVR